MWGSGWGSEGWTFYFSNSKVFKSFNLRSNIWKVFISSSEPLGSFWGELIGRLCRHRPPFSNIFSKTAGLTEAKFHVEPPWVGGTKVHSKGLGHNTKMAAMPIYGKNPLKIFFSGTKGTWAKQSLFTWWPWVDLDLFYGKVKLASLCFYMGKYTFLHEKFRKSFNGRNYNKWPVTTGLCWYKKIDSLEEVVCPCLRAI